jgi:ribosome-binding protein aMBF1 (putative translation factor)
MRKNFTRENGPKTQPRYSARSLSSGNPPCPQFFVAARAKMRIVRDSNRRQVQAAIALRIKAMRRRRGWSQNHLARRCRITTNLLGQIERGNRNFRLESLLPIVKGLNTTVAKLFLGIA